MDNGQIDILSKLLSDPKNLALISGVAKNFIKTTEYSDNDNKVSSETVAEEKPVADKNESNVLPDTITVPTISHYSERENLLRSIKPYLKAERQPKVDSLIKALNIAKIISSYTENNHL